MKKGKLRALGAVTALALAVFAAEARAQTSEFYLGQLQQFGTNWCPQDWARADGRLLSIAQNSALYSLLGTTYGGDGVVTFALPDLRDRMAIGQSNNYPLGAMFGHSSATVLNSQMPQHNHLAFGDPTGPVNNSPSGSMLGLYPAGQNIYAPPSAPLTTVMNARAVGLTGGSQPVSTQMPVLATNWCIALTGIYPSRS